MKAGLRTERFNEIIPLDGRGGRRKGCEVRGMKMVTSAMRDIRGALMLLGIL